MPGLVFRRRRLLLGGDEFMLPYATSACGRLAWVLFVTVGLIITANMLLTEDCLNTGYLVFSYEVLSVLIGGLSIFVEFQIAMASTFGTIINPGPRNELMEKHLSQKAVLCSCQLALGFCGMGLMVYVPLQLSCNDSVTLIQSGLLLTTLSQFLDAGGQYCCFLAFTSADSIWIHDDSEEDPHLLRHGMLAELEMKYESFCRTACKWMAWFSCTFNVFGGGEQEADFSHVSRVFSRMLSARRYVDFVATDIAAGLILLRHVQKSEDFKRRDELRGITADGAITVDPGLADANGTAASLPASPTKYGSGHGHGGREGGFDSHVEAGRVGEGKKSPGNVPLDERPQKHRKYYKVSRDEKIMDVTRGGEDWKTLAELAHFVKYSNVMYSVWTTFVIDPWSGVKKVIRRSGSWCPQFISRRGARHRSSLFHAATGLSSGNRGSLIGLRGDIPRNASVTSSSSFAEKMEMGKDDQTGSNYHSPVIESDAFEAEIRGDNWWGSHETALRAELPAAAELVLAHFKNCLDETPYCVVVDHDWQTIVITIRGSHSFEDFIVDAMAEPRSLESVGKEWGFDGRGMDAHEGILRRTEWIRRDLEKSGVLQMLLGDPTGGQSDWGVPASLPRQSDAGANNGRDSDRDNSRDSNRDRSSQENRPSSASRPACRSGAFGMRSSSSHTPLTSAIGGSGFCSGYKVRIVGHSLGAGCAALLALLLEPRYPSVKALAISPPGGLVSEGACREATEGIVTSLVLNDDLIPRMSSQSIEALADKVLEVLGRSRVSKLFVMRSLLRVDEGAHRPELYLDPAPEGQSLKDNFGQYEDEDEPPILSLAMNAHGDHMVSPSAASNGDSIGEGSDARVGGGEEEGGGVEELRYHRQLRQYRQHLREEYGSRRHFHRLRPPGRIVRLVNTDFIVENVDVTACENGCFSFCYGWCSSSLSPKEDVNPCCCTSGKRQQRKRVFTPVWSSSKDLADIKVTPAFLVDHSPDEILKAVEQTLGDLGVDD